MSEGSGDSRSDEGWAILAYLRARKRAGECRGHFPALSGAERKPGPQPLSILLSWRRSRHFTATMVSVSAFVGGLPNAVVAENPSTPPEEWQNHVLQRAKENGSGEYRLGYWDDYELTYEYNGYLPSIGRRL